MNETLRNTILQRLKRDYKFRDTNGDWLRGGKCPACNAKELYIHVESPWVLRCGRLNKCGQEWSVKDLYDDLFDNWSERHKQTAEDPHAAARAYLRDARGLNITKLARCYTQEWHQNKKLSIGSATVRFPMPDGGYWERLIDRPERFGKKKANLPWGYKYGGHVWHHPSLSLDELAGAGEIWFAEGIFDAVALGEAFEKVRPQARAASTISTNNYPAKFLKAIAEAVAAKGTSARRPTLVFAFDVGAAGVTFTRKYVELAIKEGWHARAAQVQPDGEGAKLDWNDLLQRDKLTADDLQTYLENGDITIAPNAAEKAFLLFRRTRRHEFPLTFKGRQLWARFSGERINEKIIEYEENRTHTELTSEEKLDAAARECGEVTEVANCTFRVLYYETDTALGKNSYYIKVDFPGKQDRVKANFPGNVMLKEGPFADHLVSVAPGAIWDGSSRQLKILMGRQIEDIRTVDGLYFTGYSIDHGAWMFENLAVTDGRIIHLNEEDYFEIGKVGVKPHGQRGEFAIEYDPNAISFSWWQDLYIAFGALGLVTLAFFFLSLFAEQVRRSQQSLGFLEVSGEPGSGKSTLLIFMWKLVGRLANYEGFDPESATAAGIARELVKYGNIPVILLEGDRNQDQSHRRRFDWSELKKIYNGHSPRTRGVVNGGTDTFSPPFRGSIIIAQNAPIRHAEEAVLERIMPLNIDQSRFSPEGRAAGERLKNAEVDQVSHWIIAMIRQEKNIMQLYKERFKVHERALLGHPEVTKDRLAFNHAQLAAALDCMAKAMVLDGQTTISPVQLAEGHNLITQMCLTQHGALGADHPIIQQFWESFDYLDAKMSEGKLETEVAGLNHHRKSASGLIAFRIAEVESAFNTYRLEIPGKSMLELKKMLPGSKTRKFLGNKNVNGADGKHRFCWVFQKPQEQVLPI